jgi:hypothetical protein
VDKEEPPPLSFDRIRGVNLLFATQGAALGMFAGVAKALAGREPLGRVGFTVADSANYGNWTADNPDFESRGYSVLKEWEITAHRDGKPDLTLLAHYEKLIGGPAGLFGAIVADRRLFLGPDCTVRQDYRRRFTDDQLLVILQNGLVAVEKLFDTVKPDAVVGFICVSLLEYLSYLFARARGVRCLNMRTTRIGNRFCYASTLNDPSPELVFSYAACRKGGSPYDEIAREHIDSVRHREAKYEGSLRATSTPVQRVSMRGGRLTAAIRFMRGWLRHRSSEAARDNHVPDPLRVVLHKAVLNPLRARRVERALRHGFVTLDALKGRRFAFFPLHTEPEVSLLIYGRPLMNQIEIVRWLALSLPADMILVVKEHPWMIGKRTLGAYRKLLNIPRVRLAAPEIDTLRLTAQADLVAVHTSSVGLEGVVFRKPVLSLGHCPFNLLPETMVSRCQDLTDLPSAIRTLLENHRHDEDALVAFVSALASVSIDINLYSNLLGRQWTIATETRSFLADVERLAHITRDWLSSPPSVADASSLGAARW